jgi:hypothetical protein
MQQLLKFITLLLLVCTAQHVSGVFTPIIRSSTTAVAASGFTLERGGSSAVGRGRAGYIWAKGKPTSRETANNTKPENILFRITFMKNYNAHLF